MPDGFVHVLPTGHIRRPVTSAHHSVLPGPRNRLPVIATMAQRVTIQQAIGGHADALAGRDFPESVLLTRAAVFLAELHGGEPASDVRLLEIAACLELALEQRVVRAANDE